MTFLAILVPNSWGLSCQVNLQGRAMNSTIGKFTAHNKWKMPKFEARWCCDYCSAPFDWWQLSIKEWAGGDRAPIYYDYAREGLRNQRDRRSRQGLGGELGGLVGSWRVRRKPEVHRGSPAPLSHHCLRPFLGKLNIIPSNSLADSTNQLS